MFQSTGEVTINAVKEIKGVFSILRGVLYWIFIGPFKKKPVRLKNVFSQLEFSGNQSILIVFFVTIFTGIVLAMQTAYQLEKMGALIYVGSLVAVSLCRELSPVLTALVVAGRVGSSIAAEIGTMKVTEQIEALETMAINPVRFLAAPRFIALSIMLPCLTVLGNLSGILGGFLVGVMSLKINPYLYMQMSYKNLMFKDVYTGLIKSIVFGMVIALVACLEGLTARGGASGVGRATTRSVVISFIMIILFDCALTAVFFFNKL
ncbi:MAG: ABC transporter permease [Candidatus Omnitrophica bacterium]|nr:ABC transporter permease [Candidatus Omnitrophota bacterium]